MSLRRVQRFQNLEKAYARLQSALAQPVSTLTELEQEGVVQRFEYTYEFAWKTVKDYLEHSGVIVEPATPRAVIREAFSLKLIHELDVWMDLLDERNLRSRI